MRVEPQPGSFDFPIRFSEFVRGLGFARSTVFADRTSDLFAVCLSVPDPRIYNPIHSSFAPPAVTGVRTAGAGGTRARKPHLQLLTWHLLSTLRPGSGNWKQEQSSLRDGHFRDLSTTAFVLLVCDRNHTNHVPKVIFIC